MKINVKKLNHNAIIPTRGTEQAVGYDLYACIDSPVTIAAHSTQKIGTGLAIEIPEGYGGFLFARSGLACKEGLAPANKVGVIDPDYRGEFIVALHNHTSEEKLIMPKMRIAQLAIIPCMVADIEEVDNLSETNRGDGGFGSTGR
jgi:dUTP pyrophosphatase